MQALPNRDETIKAIQNLDIKFVVGVILSEIAGWADVVIYIVIENYTLMAGYSYNENPIKESEVLFNILAPAVIQNHITASITRKISEDSNLTLAFMYALNNSVKGANPLEAPGQQSIEITMRQWQIEFGFAFSGF